MKQQKIKVYRTTEGTIMEVVFLLMAVAVWGCIIYWVSRAPETVPTHFRADGTPDAYGSPMKILLPCIILTVLGGCMMLGAYFPHTVNLPFSISRPSQYPWVVRMMRIIGLLMLPLVFCIALSALALPSHSIVPVISSIAAPIVASIVFTILIYRA